MASLNFLWIITALVSLTGIDGSITSHRASRHQYDLKKIYTMMEETVEKSRTLEKNIIEGARNTGYQMTGGPLETVMSSWGDDTALKEAKSAFILAKTASASLDQCKMSGSNENSCLKEMALVDLIHIDQPKCRDDKFRSPDGICNNAENPRWGTAYSQYSRIAETSSYHDGIWFTDFVNSQKYPNPLNVSASLLSIMEQDLPEITFGFTAWSKLVSHDLSHTASYRNFFTKKNIKCCRGDHRVLPRYRHPLCFYMNGPDECCVSYARSMLAVPQQQLSPAEQMNLATHFLDASHIYGSNPKIEKVLRLKSGGRLKEIHSNEIQDVPLNCVEPGKCFLTGDLRNLLDPSSAVGYLLLVKEHNRLAKLLSKINPHWEDETLFLEAKRILIAQVQHITYNEWLPMVIGRKMYRDKSTHLRIASSGYSDFYKVKTDPSVFNEFANAALKPLTWLNEIYLWALNKQRHKQNLRPLRHSLIHLDKIQNASLIQGLGMALPFKMSKNLLYSDKMVGLMFAEDKENEQVRSLALDIHRGRDHGLLPFFNYGETLNFEQNIAGQNLELIEEYYKPKNTVDLLVGGILEDKVKKTMVGRTFQEIISRQMSATRTGDKFFYDNFQQPYPFSIPQLNEIKKASFARLVCDNFNVKEIQASAFLPPSDRNPLVLCSDEEKLKTVHLKYWQ